MGDGEKGGCWSVVRILGGFFLVLFLIGAIIQGVQKGWEAFRGTPTAPVAEKSPQPAPVPDPAKPGPPPRPEDPEKPAKTPAQLLSEGKRLLSEKKIYDATGPLHQITPKDKEYSQAQALIKKTYALQKQAAEKLRRERQKEKEAERILYCALLEERFLSHGYDFSVKTLGKGNTTLRLKWVLIGRPLVHNLTKDGKLAQEWRELGFDKVIFTDGFRSTWTIDLK